MAHEIEIFETLNLDFHQDIIPPNVLFSATNQDAMENEMKSLLMESGPSLQRELMFVNGKVSDNFPHPVKSVGIKNLEKEEDSIKLSHVLFSKLILDKNKILRKEKLDENRMYAEIALKHADFKPKPISTEKKNSIPL